VMPKSVEPTAKLQTVPNTEKLRENGWDIGPCIVPRIHLKATPKPHAHVARPERV
jgi:hypothetical protein